MDRKTEILKKIEELKQKKHEAEQAAKLQDVFQHSYKIFLNSVYGFTGTQFSPVFNRDIAESVTLTGQAATREMVKYTNKCLNKIGGTDDTCEWVVAGDTDSIFPNSKIYLNGEKISVEDAFDHIIKNGSKVDVLENGTEVIIPNKNIKTESQNGTCNLKNISRHKVNKQAYSIEIPEFEKLMITEDHSIMVYRDGEIVECKPSQIRKTDQFIVKCRG